jgi:glycosyltransferase involved in cell wall biosynthesis
MASVSVILPTYNRAQLLNISINSVLSQTYRDFELILIDDCSTDSTSSVLDSITDDRVRVIKNTSNKGIAAVRNIGVMNSRGKYIAFLDDDDEWLPDKLEKQVKIIEESSPVLGCVYTGIIIIMDGSNNTSQTKVSHFRKNILNNLLFNNFITTSTMLIKKECFEKTGLFDESIPYGEDYDMWIRIAEIFEFENISEPLVKYRIHSNSISANHGAIIKGLETLMSKHESLFASNNRAKSNHLLELGIAYCYLGNTIAGKKAFLNALKLNKFDERIYYNLLLSELGAEKFIKLKELKNHYFPLRIKTG